MCLEVKGSKNTLLVCTLEQALTLFLIISFFFFPAVCVCVCPQGLEACWKRHKTNAELLWSGLKKLGVDVFVEDEVCWNIEV